MATPAVAYSRHVPAIDLPALWTQAALAAGLRGNGAIAQMRSALGGIANLYCAYALRTGQISFEITTKSFGSDAVPEPDILDEIAACTGVRDRARNERFLTGLTVALAIRGFGIWQAVESDSRSFRLRYELPLAAHLAQTHREPSDRRHHSHTA
jgi:hypothetical protein